MGIFDEEEAKMAKEVSASIRADEQRRAELGQVARKVSEDLLSYLVKHPRGQSIDVSVHENRVTLRKKTTSNTLEITCTGPESFELAVDGTKSSTVNKSGMARSAIDWLKP